MKPKFRNLILASSALLSITYVQAATFTWSKAVTDGTNLTTNWSSGTNWSAVPVSAADTTLVFGYTWTTNATIRTNTLTNDVANPFSLNVLTLGGATNPSAGSGTFSDIALINIAGSPLNFVSNGGLTPQVNLKANRSNGQTVSFNVQSNVSLINDTLFTGDGTANFTISGIISGAATFTKSGTSTLALSGANDYTGGTTINSGTITVNSTGTLGQNINTNNVSVNAGARLNLSAAGNTGANQTITLTSTAGSLATLGLGYNGIPAAAIAQADTNGGVIAINSVVGYNQNLSSLLTGKNLFLGGIGTTSTFTGAAGTIVAGNGSTYRLGGGGGSISFNTANLFTGANAVQIGSAATGGTGTVIMGAAQDYTGTTTITGGTLSVSAANRLGGAAADLVFDGGTLQVTGTALTSLTSLGRTNPIVFNATKTVGLDVTDVANTFTVGQVLNQTTGGFTKSGAGTAVLNQNNTFTGAVNFNAGTLRLENINAIGSASALNALTGTTLQLRSDSASTFANTRLNPSGTITINADQLSSGSGNTLTLGGTVAYVSSATSQINFTGGNTNNVGINAMYINSATGTNTFTLNPTSANAVIGAISVNTSTTNTGFGAGTAQNVQLVLGGTATNNTITSITEVSNANTQLIFVKNTAATWTLGNVDTKKGNGHIMSAGTLTLNGTFKFDFGTDRKFTLSGGVLNYNNAGAIQTNAATTSGNGFNITGGSLDNTSGAAITTSTTNPRMTWGGNLTFIGTNGANSNLNIGTGAVFLTATRQVSVTNAAATLTVGGIISGSGFGVTKAGDGTLELKGANTYTGTTTVSGGTLAIGTGGSINSSSGITIASGAHFKYNSSTALTVGITNNGGRISGSGTIGVAVAMDSTSDIIAPGNSPGFQPYGVSQTWSSLTYEWENNNFTGTTAGTDFDQINITGALNLTGAVAGSYVLDLISLSALNAAANVPNFSEVNRSWDILTATGGITGFNAAYWTIDHSTGLNTFTSSPTWGGTWLLSLNDTAGTDSLVLTYTAVPEPGAALMGSLGMLALFRRRRH